MLVREIIFRTIVSCSKPSGGTLRKIAPDTGSEPPTWTRSCDKTQSFVIVYMAVRIFNHWGPKCLSICTCTTCVRCDRHQDGSTWLSAQQSSRVFCIWVIKCMLNHVFSSKIQCILTNEQQTHNTRHLKVLTVALLKKMKSSGMLCCVVAVVLEVSRDRSA